MALTKNDEEPTWLLRTFGETGSFGGFARCSRPLNGREHRAVVREKFSIPLVEEPYHSPNVPKNQDVVARAVHLTWPVTIPMIHLSAAITSLAVAAVPSIGRIWVMKKW